MKVAVTYENGQIFQHFGHTEFFMLYNIEDDKIANSELVSSMGSGHGALATFLKSQNVDVLICGGIGGGAQDALSNAGIALYGGVTGNAEDAVNALIGGNLAFDPDVKCSHHGHEHSCGGNMHSCGGECDG